MPFEIGNFYAEKDTFGLDIGVHSLKVVQLKKRGKTASLVGHGSVDIPEGVIVEGIISDPEAIATTLKGLLKSIGKITATRVTASLPESKIFTRILELPEMDKKAMDEAVIWETEQYIPVPIADLYIDWQIIQRTPAKVSVVVAAPAGKKPKKKKKAEMMNDVLLVAAPKSIVDSYLQVFRLLNIEPYAIEMSLAAITRALIRTPANDPKVYLVVNAGAEDTDVGIVKGGVLRLTGSTPTGGDSFTSAISSKLKIEGREAEELKKKFGISEWGLQNKVLDAVTPILDQLVSELDRVSKFYQERAEGAKKVKIDQVLLAGGASNMPGLAQYLEEKLGVSTVIGNPWTTVAMRGVRAVPKTDIPLYTTAIGLAMRGVEE